MQGNFICWILYIIACHGMEMFISSNITTNDAKAQRRNNSTCYGGSDSLFTNVFLFSNNLSRPQYIYATHVICMSHFKLFTVYVICTQTHTDISSLFKRLLKQNIDVRFILNLSKKKK